MAGDASAFEEDLDGNDHVLDAATSPVHQLPLQFGRYRLEERLGVGGMAEVFLATRLGDGGFERLVVVKRILPHLAAKPRFVEMFLREAKLVAKLDHPNIVSVYDFGQVDGAYFLTMEYVEGLSLRDIRRRCRQAQCKVPLDVAVRAIAEVALALDAVHRQTDDQGRPLNLVHRDVSPDNILLASSGQAKLLDFGIAKSDGEDSLTQTGELKGKIPYMPPEQISGEPIDGRADLYALGASLYALVCGRRPIEAKTDLLALSAILSQRPTPPRALRADIPVALELYMLRLLEKKKERRPASGAEVHDALLRAVPAAMRRNLDAIAALAALPDVDGEVSARSGSESAPPRSNAPPSEIHPPPVTEEFPARRHTPPTSVVRAQDFELPSAASPMPPVTPRGGRRAGLMVGVLLSVVMGVIAIGSAAALLWPTASPSDVATRVPLLPVGVTSGTAPSGAAPEDDSQTIPAEVPQDDAPSVGAERPASDAVTPNAIAPNATAPDAIAPNATATDLDDTPAEATAEPEMVSERPRTVRTQTVKLVGPPKVRWLVGSRTRARGTGRLEVSPRTKSLLAVDDARKFKATVPIRAGVADFGALQTGTLSVRVLPFAKVYVGKVFLGQTPLAPIPLAAGHYSQVRFVGETATQTVSVRIQPGQMTKVKIDLTKPLER